MNALAVATGEQGFEFFAFDASYVEKLRAGDAQVEGQEGAAYLPSGYYY